MQIAIICKLLSHERERVDGEETAATSFVIVNERTMIELFDSCKDVS